MNLSRRIAHLKPLATTAMHGRVEALLAHGKPVTDFSIAISHFPVPDSVMAAVQQGLRQPTLPYTAVGGALAVREELASKVRNENGIAASASEILVTNGAKQALYQALYVMADPGDAAIVFRPHWPAYVATCKLLGIEALLVDQPQTFTAEALERLPRAKILIINNPHNPTGKVLSASEIECIAAWMARTGTRAIVDESYEKLIFEGSHISLAARRDWQAAGIVTIFSCSQSYAMMGWRAGFAVASAELVAAMETLQGPITAAAPALTQLALAAAFTSGDPTAMLEDYRQRREMVLELVAPVAWMRMERPASGPYLWADISVLTMDTVAFSERLLAHSAVAVMPGEALGQPGYIRIGYIAADTATLRQGVEAIIRFGDMLAAEAAHA